VLQSTGHHPIFGSLIQTDESSLLQSTRFIEPKKESNEHREYRWVESNSGPPRKYFSLTEKGESFYKELEQTWNELSNGVNALARKNDQPLNN
jgi:hypothetical protein